MVQFAAAEVTPPEPPSGVKGSKSEKALHAKLNYRQSTVSKSSDIAEHVVELSPEELFSMVDTDGNGEISRDEFHKLHGVMVGMLKGDLDRETAANQSKTRARRRAGFFLFLLLFLLPILGLSVAANLVSTQWIVGKEISTTTGGTSGTAATQLMDKDSNTEVVVAQSGLEVPLGFLPFLSMYAPEQALEASPEFVVVSEGSSQLAFRISTIAFSLPFTLTMKAVDGTHIALNGMSLAGQLVYDNNRTFEVCTLCSLVQLRSVITTTPGFAAALRHFNDAAAHPNEQTRDTCVSQPQIGRLLSIARNQTQSDRFATLPAVCHMAHDDSDDDTVAARELEEEPEHSRKLQSGGFSGAIGGVGVAFPISPIGNSGSSWNGIHALDLFDHVNTQGNQGRNAKISPREFWNNLPAALVTVGAVESIFQANALMSTTCCCSFHSVCGNKCDRAEFILLMGDLLSGYLDMVASPMVASYNWFDDYAVNIDGTCYQLEQDTNANGDAGSTNAGSSVGRRKLSHVPGCPQSNSGCHPASSTLMLEDGRTIRIDEVKEGERIATPSGFEPVVGRLHADKGRSMRYFRFTAADNTSVAISHRHHLIVNGERTAPEKVRVGDVLSTPRGPQPIVSVGLAEEHGVYAVITPSGTYYVDGVECTTYVAYIPYMAWRIFADGYVHLRYLLGVPIVPDGEGQLPLFKQYELLEAVQLPEPLMFALWPLTLTMTVVVEVINKVLTLSPAVCTACVATLALTRASGRAKVKTA